MATRVVYGGGAVYKMGCGIPCHIYGSLRDSG